MHAGICDVMEPWPHGTVVRATRYPSYYDFNVVRVEDDPRMTVEELVAFSDEALAGLAHRRVEFDMIGPADAARAGFQSRGWEATRLLWMHHESPPPPGPDVAVERVPRRGHRTAYRLASRGLPRPGSAAYHAEAREVAMRRAVEVLAVREDGEPVAFAQLEREGSAAEITQVYVHPDHRGGGRGTAMTRAAIEAAGDVGDLWIVADDEDRPKDLYRRLGFRSAWTTMEFTRLP